MNEKDESNFNEATTGLENDMQNLCKTFRCLNYTDHAPSERNALTG